MQRLLRYFVQTLAYGSTSGFFKSLFYLRAMETRVPFFNEPMADCQMNFKYYFQNGDPRISKVFALYIFHLAHSPGLKIS